MGVLVSDLKVKKTTCKDCGVETVPGVGSARCPGCWDDKCGPGYDFSESIFNKNNEENSQET